MAFITTCDKCGKVFDGGFTGQLQKSVVISKKNYEVVVTVRPKHLCDPCFNRIMSEVLKK